MKREALKQIFKSPLGRRLFLFILLFSSAITLIITAVQIYNEYKYELSAIDAQYEQIKNTSLDSLSQSVWVMDDIQVNKQLEGLIEFSYVDHASVTSDGELLWETGRQELSNPFSSVYDLTYTHRGNEVIIAQLQMKGSLNAVYFQLLNTALFILIGNAIKTSLVAIFVLFITYHLFGKHIIQLANFASQFNQSKELPAFSLQRSHQPHSKEDELDTLAQSLNHMIGRLKEREEALKVFATAVEQSPNVIILTDEQGKIEYANKSFTALSGYSLEEVKGRTPSILGTGNTPRPIYKELWETITNKQSWSGEFQNRTKDGDIYWEHAQIGPILDDDGNIIHYLAIKEDVTLRKSYEEQLLRQANFDTLTELPNRILAFDRISQALAGHQREKGQVVIMFIDLDRFKNINDTLGHSAGDELLINSAGRLKECVRVEDTVARLGGDEFLIVLSNVRGAESIDIIASKIIDSFTKPFQIDGRDVYVTASIGITLYPDDGDDPQILLRNADSAMYKAKSEGRNSFCYYTKAMNDQAKARLEIESHLRNALNNRELEIHYQPIIDANTNQVTSAEALLRWNSPALGQVPPDRFIPLAEDIGIIVTIGNWVLRTACMMAASWQKQSGLPIRIAVNVSVKQFTMGYLINVVKDALHESGLSAKYLELEITEGLLLEDAPGVQESLKTLNQMGVGLSIDDFGTGYSALSYIKKFSFDILKIDRSFIRDIETDKEDAALSNAIIKMAHALGHKVIAEGVETEGQLAFLKSNQIDMIQGYLFSKPLPAKDFSNFLNQVHRVTNPIEQSVEDLSPDEHSS